MTFPRIFLLATLIALPFSVQAQAPPRTYVDRFIWTVPLDGDGSLKVDNPFGGIIVTGTEERAMVVEAVRSVEVKNASFVREARIKTSVIISGTPKQRLIQTTGAHPVAAGRWAGVVSYVIRVPRSVHVTLVARNAQPVRVGNINGNVVIRTTSNDVHASALGSFASIDSINGSLFVSFPFRPRANLRLATVNGQIELRVPPGSGFGWIAETLKGEIATTLPVQGGFDPRAASKSFQGTVNGASVPRVETISFTGRTSIVDGMTPVSQARLLVMPEQARSVAAGASAPRREDVRRVYQQTVQTLLIQPPGTQSFAAQTNEVPGNLKLAAQMGNLFVGEVQGNAHISSRAGDIVLGRVLGTCTIRSLGGPLNLGEIVGELDATTSAGDVLVRAARKGGTAATEGGNIHVFYSGGPITLSSGGGNITLRGASSEVRALTKSGDITIGVNPDARNRSIDAKTSKGNIFLYLPTGFAADIDATILTSRDTVHSIESQLPGLVITKERVGTRTRIHAAGKVNGGGAKLNLHAEDGNIQLRLSSPASR